MEEKKIEQHVVELLCSFIYTKTIQHFKSKASDASSQLNQELKSSSINQLQLHDLRKIPSYSIVLSNFHFSENRRKQWIKAHADLRFDQR